MDATRLAQIEQAVEVLSREGLEVRLVRELLEEVKRLRRSEGAGQAFRWPPTPIQPPLPRLRVSTLNTSEQDGLPAIHG